MAVLIEAISVIIKVESILSIFNNNIDKFESMIPNNTVCSDNELYRIGFMATSDAFNFVKNLENVGFVHLENNLSQDIVLICQKNGFYSECEWAECYNYKMKTDKFVVGCRIKEGKEDRLFLPESWTYESSLYCQGDFIESEDKISETHTLIEVKDNVSKYINNDTGKIVYIGRTKNNH